MGRSEEIKRKHENVLRRYGKPKPFKEQDKPKAKVRPKRIGGSWGLQWKKDF